MPSRCDLLGNNHAPVRTNKSGTLRQTRLIIIETPSLHTMLPEERFNLVAGLESRHKFIRNAVAIHLGEDIDDDSENDGSPLNWKIHLSPEGAERTLFNQHLHFTDARSFSIAPSSKITLGDLHDELRLPPELQLRVIDFCSDDRMTLLQLMQTSSFLRAEASKIFFSDPHTYYSVDASWLLTGGQPGHIDYSMSFLRLVQNIEIDYGVDADSIISPRAGDWWFPQVRDAAAERLWKVMKEKFPNVKRVVLYQTSARHSMYHRPAQHSRHQENISPWLRRLLESCPPGIDAAVFIAVAHGSPVFRRGRIRANNSPMHIERALYRISNKGEMKKVAPRRPYRTVLIPMRVFSGPVGHFEKVKYLDGRIECQRRGLGLTMIEAIDQYDFAHNDFFGPSSCPMRYCNERFTQSGQWALHAALEHVNDLIPGRQFEGWPPELRQKLASRNVELLQMKQRNDFSLKRIQQEWDEATEDERMKIKKAWMEQLGTDPNWDTGVPAAESPLWRRFESWMRERMRAREASEVLRRDTGECAPTCPCRRETAWKRFKGWMQSWWTRN
ncbi:uncharacterized protein CC84DRAFT_1203152 [Paraphaeosphaeria sporulosa]|uniref:C2H2-type domain-containing protein n=1 Tax=Paraphaeosphaeria sporulosa TaxID=1460663 RepID=A0A177CTF3_9PLEO|nr:uncharacterized protein CC84DRAFT_1203152 [Paraphaeosphaeria sporulosa]OAG10814.1 hypothetical protein CC84DRAFT_1203152 [Paraphaeosphaeria sporulosa]